jgi:adenosylcobinamide-GDP ribazoletransferase
VRSLLAGVAFLTRLPVGRMAAFDEKDVAGSFGWFPLIGILLGCVSALAAALCRPYLPVAVVAVVLVATDALLTGGLHFDGLADTADGFGGGKSREDVLRIMRDHAIGSYGGLALALAVGLKATAYAGLLRGEHWVPALILTPALGRWSMLPLTAALPYARPAASVIRGMGRGSLIWGTVVAIGAVAAARSMRGWVALGVAAAVTAGFGLWCRRRIGGITGDTLGANLQLCESAALLTFLWARTA